MSEENDFHFDGASEVNREVSRLIGAPKTHVNPRIDAVWFQAEIPEFDVDGVRSKDDRIHMKALQFPTIYTQDSSAVRNIFSCHLCPTEDQTWDTTLLDVPLESDEAVLDYLAEFDYDGQRALLNLLVDLGCGKEYVFAQRGIEQVKRRSAGIAFTDSRENYLLADPLHPAGMFLITRSPTVINEQHQEIEENTPRVAKQRYLGSRSPHPSAASFAVRSTALDSAPLVEDNLLSTTTLQFIPASGDNRDRQNFESASNTLTIEDNRQSRSNSSNQERESKNNLKRDWQSIYRQATELLNRCAASGGSRGYSATSSAIAVGVTGKQLQVLERDAMELLVFAASLPSYVNSPGECFGENVRTALGELLLLCVGSHAWNVEVRDALYDSVKPRVTLSKLYSLLTQGRSLRIVDPAVQNALQLALSERNELARVTTALAWGMRDLLSNASDTSGTTFTLTPPDDGELVRLTLADARSLLLRDERQPRAAVLRTHSALLRRVVGLIEEMATEVDEVVHLAEVCAVRKQRMPSIQWRTGDVEVGHRMAVSSSHVLGTLDPSTGDGLRLTLLRVQELRSRVLALPISFPNTRSLLATIEEAEGWQRQVHALMQADGASMVAQQGQGIGQAQGVENSRNRRGTNQVSTVVPPTTSVVSTAGKAVSLKRVEALLQEAEKLVVAFPTEIEYLNEKKARAKQWLERLKKSFLVRGATAQQRAASLRKGNSSQLPHGPGEKVRLEDMRQLVQEGELMEEDAEEFEGSEATGAVGRGAAARELSRAQNALSAAEEWLQRVRELLSDSYDSAVKQQLHGLSNTNQNGKRQKSMSAIETGSEDGDKILEDGCDDHDDNCTEKNVNDDVGNDYEDEGPPDMRSLLRELLTEAEDMPVQMNEVSVLRVHLRALDWAVAARAALPPADTTAVSGASEKEKAISMAGENRAEGAEEKGLKCPTYATVQALAAEIKIIRADLPPEVAIEFGVRPLPDEERLLTVAHRAETLLSAVKRLCQGGSVKRGTRLSRAVSLLAESTLLPVVMPSDLKPLKDAVLQVADWLSTHATVMASLGIKCDLAQTDIFRVAAGMIDTNESGNGDETDNVDEETATAYFAADGSTNVTDEMFSEAVVDLPTLTKAVQTAESLMLDFSEIKSIRLRLHQVQSWATQVRERTQPDKRNKSCSVGQLHKLLKEGQNLRVSMPEEFDLLRKGLGDSQNWDDQVTHSLHMLVLDHVRPLGKQLSLLSQSVSALQTIGYSSLQCLGGIVGMHYEQNGSYESVWTSSNIQAESSSVDKELCRHIDYMKAMFEELILNSEKQGLISSRHTDLSFGLAAVNWINHVRSLLIPSEPTAVTPSVFTWPHVNKETLKNLVKDCEWILTDLTFERPFEVDSEESIQFPGDPFPVLEAFSINALGSDEDERNSELLARLFPAASTEMSREIVDSDLEWEAKDAKGRTNSRRATAGQKRTLYPEVILNYRGRQKLSAANSTISDSPTTTATKARKKQKKVELSNHASTEELPKLLSEPGPRVSSLQAMIQESFASSQELISEQKSPRHKRAIVPSDATFVPPNWGSTGRGRGGRGGRTGSGRGRGGRGASGRGQLDSPIAFTAGRGAGKKRAKIEELTKSAITNEQLIEPTDSVDTAFNVSMELNESFETNSDPTQYAVPTVESIAYLAPLKRAVVLSQPEEGNENCLLIHQYRYSLTFVLNFWLRMVYLLRARVNEANKWDRRARQLIFEASEVASSLTGAVALSMAPTGKITHSAGLKLLRGHAVFDQLTVCLLAAQHRGLKTPTRMELETLYSEAVDWYRRSESMLRREKGSLLTPSALTAFIRRGESLIVYGESACSRSVLGILVSSNNVSSQPSPDKGDPKNDTMDTHVASTDPTFEEDIENDDEKDNGYYCTPKQQSAGYYLNLLRLRNELRVAKNWVSKVQNSQVGQLDVDLCISEAETLCADVSEQLDAIQQTVQCYCFCRMGYHGEMIGCDQCPEWYHYSCVGLNPVHADKIEKYICLRCSLQGSFLDSARQVATITNKWMKPSELAKHREARRLKIDRKRAKEERELAVAEKQLRELLHTKTQFAAKSSLLHFPTPAPPRVLDSTSGVPALPESNIEYHDATESTTRSFAAEETVVAAATVQVQAPQSFESQSNLMCTGEFLSMIPSAAMTSSPQAPTQTALAPVAASSIPFVTSPATIAPSQSDAEQSAAERVVETQLLHIRKQIMDCKSRLERTKAEEDHLIRQAEVEHTHKSSAAEWMHAMQGVMWPLNQDDLEIGRPASIINLTPNSPLEVHYSPESMGLAASVLPAGMPKGMTNAYEAARALGVDEIDDVTEVFEAFRYMSWLSITLQCLRRPLPTAAYRILLEAAKPLKWVDERLMKSLTGLASRASLWKTKARRLLATTAQMTVTSISEAGSSLWVEAAKVRPLVEEGVGIPLFSRLKDRLNAALADYLSRHPLPVPKPGEAAPAPTGKPKGRQHLVPAHPSTHVRLTEAPENSSDEESEGLKIGRSRGCVCTYPSTMKPANPSPDLWPARLGFERIRLHSEGKNATIEKSPAVLIVTSSSLSSSSALNSATSTVTADSEMPSNFLEIESPEMVAEILGGPQAFREIVDSSLRGRGSSS